MIFWRATIPASLAASLFFLASSHVSGQESDKLHLTQAHAQPGDVYVLDHRYNSDLTYEGVDPKNPSIRLTGVNTYAGRRKIKTAFLPSRQADQMDVRQTFLVDQIEQADPKSGDTVTKGGPLQGKTVYLRHHGKTIVVNVASGKLPDSLAKELRTSLLNEERSPPMFPHREVSPGVEWNVDPRGFSTILGFLKLRSMHARLEDVGPFAGHPCARIAIALTAVETTPFGPSRYNLRGELQHAIDIQHDLSLTLDGEITATSRSKTPRGVSVPVEGHGSYETRITATWQLGPRRTTPAPAGPAGGTPGRPATWVSGNDRGLFAFPTI